MREPDWKSPDGAIRLYLGDCLALLPELEAGSVDAVVTDPPFGIGDKMQGGTWGSAGKYADMRAWDAAPPPPFVTTLRTVAPQAIIWGGNYFDLPPSRCWLVWDKRNAVPTMADAELAWTSFDRPAKRFSGNVGVHAHGHPCEKPVPLLKWCVEMTTGTVCDPYMGSGTTGVACIRTGRRFIGMEIDPTYFAIAVKRIEAELNRTALFDGPAKKQEQAFLV